MQNKEEVSKEHIGQILANLPTMLDSLLERYISTTLPDYDNFTKELNTFLEPLAQYADERFHAGQPEDNPYGDAMRMIAVRKLELEQKLKTGGKDASIDNIRAMTEAYKLLMEFFGYANKNKMPALFDIQYRYDTEKDPAEKRKILQQGQKVFAGSSSEKFILAVMAFENGALEEALRLCDESIARFKGQTPAYKLKSKILAAMVQKSIKEGLKIEPRDVALKDEDKLQQIMDTLRANFNNGTLDIDAFAEKLAQSTKDEVAKAGIELKPYEEKIRQKLKNIAGLSDVSMIFLATGEYLMASLPFDCDQAPAGLEFCKALEMELERILFASFRKVAPLFLASRKLATDDKERIFHDYCYSRTTITIGNMASVIRFAVSEQAGQYLLFTSFRNHLKMLSDDGARQLANGLNQKFIHKYRNSAAHPTIYNSAKAQEASEWAYMLLKLILSTN